MVAWFRSADVEELTWNAISYMGGALLGDSIDFITGGYRLSDRRRLKCIAEVSDGAAECFDFQGSSRPDPATIAYLIRQQDMQ